MRKPRVYLASRFSLQKEHLPRIADLEANNMLCCARWITEEPELSAETTPGLDELRAEWGQKDYNDVVDADAMVAFSESPDGDVPGRSRGGRHVEFGIALALGIPIIVVGPKENIFHYLVVPNRIEHVETWEQALAKLNEMFG